MRPTRTRRHRGFVERVNHYGREFARGADHFFRVTGPAIKQVAATAAPALLAQGMPTASAGVAAIGQAADGYSQLRSAMGGIKVP